MRFTRIIGHIFTSVPASLRRGMKHLQPEIERRQKMYDEYGQDWPDKPVRRSPSNL